MEMEARSSENILGCPDTATFITTWISLDLRHRESVIRSKIAFVTLHTVIEFRSGAASDDDKNAG